MRQFLKDTSLDFPVVMDPDGKISYLYQVEPIPHTVIIGPDGIVRWVHIGASCDLKAELTGELDRLVTGD